MCVDRLSFFQGFLMGLIATQGLVITSFVFVF